MSEERDLVEQYVREALAEAKGIKDDPRLRAIAVFGSHLGAAVLYGLGELDNHMYKLSEAIDKEVADAAIMLLEEQDQLYEVQAPQVGEQGFDEVRARIDDELEAAEAVLTDSSEHLTAADKLIMGIALRLGGSLTIQVREIDYDLRVLVSTVQNGMQRLVVLLQQ